ncbi:hypothetical protein EMCRGX_G001078 [Ephydatia muelleri]
MPEGFPEIKRSQAPVLCRYPSLTKDFELQTDASAVSLGAVLEQDGHVVAYASEAIQTLSTWTSISLAYRPSTVTMAVCSKDEGCRENPTQAEANSILDWNGQGHGAILQELYGVPKVQAANADTRSNDEYFNWQMLAVDLLNVPVSSSGNRYLLVLQDYFTKWAEAIPMPNQTAECIAGILIDFFSRFGIPGILHFDQGANFESTMI